MKPLNAIFGFIVLLSVSLKAQDFHASTTKIEYEPRSKELNIAARFFAADLEKVTGVSATSKDQFDAKMKSYVNEKFVIKVNGKKVNIVYRSSEVTGKAIRIYMKIENQSDISSIEVKNAMLLELFADQQNLITFDVNGVRKSFTTRRGGEVGEATF